MAQDTNLLIENFEPAIRQAGGYSSKLPMVLSGTAANLSVGGNLTVTGTLTAGSEATTSQVITATSANAFTVGPAGTTNPSFNVDTSGGVTDVTGLNVNSNAAGSGLTLTVTTSGTNENLKLDTAGSGVISIATTSTSTGGVTMGNASSSGARIFFDSDTQVRKVDAFAFCVGPNTLGGANALVVDTSTGSLAAGLTVKGAVSGGTVALSTNDSGSNNNLSIAAKGTGIVGIATMVNTHTPTAINSTNTATAAQVQTGYITSTSAAATTITLPTGTALGTALGAVQGTTMDLFIDNTAGANTVTIAVAVNGILSAAAAANGASQGLLTVPNGVTGQACFRIMFSSATAYTFTRIA